MDKVLEIRKSNAEARKLNSEARRYADAAEGLASFADLTEEITGVDNRISELEKKVQVVVARPLQPSAPEFELNVGKLGRLRAAGMTGWQIAGLVIALAALLLIVAIVKGWI
jgi:tetrahydromethanopterin S-methyltransferase subunit B